MKTALRICTTLLLTFSIHAGIVNVPGDQPNIQAGIVAAQNGDTVLVADSTYIENINFLGKAITVASFFILDGDSNHIANTIIDGSQPSHPDSGSVVTFESGEDTTSVLCGFTITGGSGTITQFTWQGSTFTSRNGGGIFTYDAGATICDNIITNNNVPLSEYAYGGGVSVFIGDGSAHARISNNTITANTITGFEQCAASAIEFLGSGIIANNNIRANISNGANEAFGAVLCWGDTILTRATINNNQITENIVNGPTTAAGGIQVEVGTQTKIFCNTITGNILNGTSFGEGGGIRLVWNTEVDTISGNYIAGNQVFGNQAYAGGIMIRDTEDSSNTLITNNLIVGNTAKEGAGIRCLGSRVQIINNTVVNNTASVSGGGIRIRGASSNVGIVNTHLWGNTAPVNSQIQLLAGVTQFYVRYSNVQGGRTGEGNINCDPFFVDTLSFELSDSSCALGAGIDSIEVGGIWYHAPATDYNGDPRPMPAGTMPDIGAQEIDQMVAVQPQPLAGIPKTHKLHQNYPNPFNPNTTIEFAVAKSGWITLRIYNVLGEEVAELVSERLVAGSYRYEWDATGLASGVYYYQLKAENFSQTRKLVLLR